jgi:PAS domain S-box-containing protein
MDRKAVATDVAPRSDGGAELLEQVLAGIDDQFFAVDREWRYLYVNDRVVEATGRPREALLGRTVWEAFPDVVGTPFEAALRRAGSDDGPSRFEYFYPAWQRWFENRVYPTRAGLTIFVADITERKRTEEALRNRTAILRAVSDSTTELIFVKDRASRLLYANPATLAAIGQTELQAIGTNEADRASNPAEAEAIMANDRRIMESGVPETIEEPYSGPTGTRIYLSTKTPLRDDAGAVIGLIGVSRDITERKLAEDALADARRRLEAALGGGRIATWVWDRATDRILSDANLAGFFGLPPDDGAGMPAAAYTDTLHAADRPRVLAELEQAVRSGADFESEFRIAAFQPPRWVYARARVEREPGGRPVRLAGVVMDITERRRAESRIEELNAQVRGRLEELESLMHVLPVAVFVAHDAACTRITANPAGAAALRVAAGTNVSLSAPGAAALPFRFRRDGAELAVADLPLHRAARSGTAVLDEEIEIAFADGIATSYSASATPLFDESGRVRGCLGVYVDITERKRTEERLRDDDRRKDEFLATLSHELRNPLAPLRNSLHLLRRSGAAPGVPPGMLEMMERQVEHLVRLVDDLMEVSRITRGNLELRRKPVALGTVLRGAIETADPLIRSGEHRLHLEVPLEAVVVDADPVRLAQVFANLLNNAAKYTDRGGTIAVEARREGGDAVVTVADSGEGIEPEEMPRLFQMFSRTDRSTRRTQGGLGIGLALAEKLVGMHGGALSAHSEGRGKGSRFTVRLPLARDAAPEGARPAAPERPAITRLRVLVVDDNRDAAESMALLLGHLGAEVMVAHDGPQSLAAFDSFRPRVVLLDIGLPGMDGYAVARALRERGHGARPVIVALTGWGQDEDKIRAREAGFDHHLVKPADLDELARILRLEAGAAAAA